MSVGGGKDRLAKGQRSRQAEGYRTCREDHASQDGGREAENHHEGAGRTVGASQEGMVGTRRSLSDQTRGTQTHPRKTVPRRTPIHQTVVGLVALTD